MGEDYVERFGYDPDFDNFTEWDGYVSKRNIGIKYDKHRFKNCKSK